MVNLLKDDNISYEAAWNDDEYKAAIVEEALRDLGSVSYTHLDVYKRQALLFSQASHDAVAFTGEAHDSFGCFCNLLIKPGSVNLVSVSYTHLDVYKRQGIVCKYFSCLFPVLSTNRALYKPSFLW